MVASNVTSWKSSPYYKGWGDPGESNSAAASEFYRKNIVKIKSADGVVFTCHRIVAPIFQRLLDTLTDKGYRFDAKRDDWGYANRDMRTGAKKSYHAWGLALDLNATTNPVGHDGRLHTDLPSDIARIAARLGLEWGGSWNLKDPMHFQFTGSVVQAVALVKSLGKTISVTPPKPKPPVVTPPVKPAPKPERVSDNDMAFTSKHGGGLTFNLNYQSSGVKLSNLRFGKRNEDVREIQRLIGMPKQYQTGYYGDITAGYVRKIQAALGMPKQYRTGNYDPMTAFYVHNFQWKRGSRGKYADGILGPKQTLDLLG